MKPINDLVKTIQDKGYFFKQLKEWGSEKNIVFVNPQLSGNHLYKMILPTFILNNKSIATAITSLDKYDKRNQLLNFKFEINPEVIEWADFLVFPFTTQPLYLEFYSKVRELKPQMRIVYTLDFNFYELSAKHPLKDIFNDESVIDAIEENMFYSDIVIVTNVNFMSYLSFKLKKVYKDKYDGINVNLNKVVYMPIIMDSNIVLSNIDDYEPQKSVSINHSVEVEKKIQAVDKTAKKIKNNTIAIQKGVKKKQKPKPKVVAPVKKSVKKVVVKPKPKKSKNAARGKKG